MVRHGHVQARTRQPRGNTKPSHAQHIHEAKEDREGRTKIVKDALTRNHTCGGTA
jgi:hypothetical protein